MRVSMLYLILGIVLGLSIPVQSSYWFDAPESATHRDYVTAKEYTEPVCPPGMGPEFFGVILIDGISRPIYTCHSDRETLEMNWEELE